MSTASKVFEVAALAFPPLALLGPAVAVFDVALAAYKQWDDDNAVSSCGDPTPPPTLPHLRA